MEFNKPVSNPMLVGCLELMKAEDTPEHRNMFTAELQKASLLAPALIEPAPEEDAEGNLKLIPGSKIQFPMLSSQDGKMYFMGFTDDMEYQKWAKQNKALPTFALKFEDYVGMMLRKDAQGNPCPALGFVINPLGANLVVPRDTIAGLMGARLTQAMKKVGARPPQRLRVPLSPNATLAGQKPVGSDTSGTEEK